MAIHTKPDEETTRCDHPSFTYVRHIFVCGVCGKEFTPCQMNELDLHSQRSPR